jgi:hypothetical protein
MHKALIAILVLIPTLASADKPRRTGLFVSDNGRFVLLLTQGLNRRVPMFENGRFKEIAKVWGGEHETWGMFDARQAEPLDGSGVEGLDVTWSPLYTFRGNFSTRTMFVGDDGITVVVVDDYSEREPSEDLEVLHFFSAGRLTKAYTLRELLFDTESVKWTASHFYWLWSRSLRHEDGFLHLVTTDCRQLQFDVSTGEISNHSFVAGADGSCEL